MEAPKLSLLTEETKYFNRDLSWLSFNYRVLQEAMDPTVPLFEKIKFLAIFSSNLDEFYRVRVAGLRSLQKINKKKLNKKFDIDPDKLIAEIKKERVLFQELAKNPRPVMHERSFAGVLFALSDVSAQRAVE